MPMFLILSSGVSLAMVELSIYLKSALCLAYAAARPASEQRKSGATVVRRLGQVSLRTRPGAQLPATQDPLIGRVPRLSI
jgi:hypothetical protein